MRFILDESHQKGSDYITSCQSCLLIQHYSCLCSDCTGFHTSKPRVCGEREREREIGHAAIMALGNGAMGTCQGTRGS